MPPRTTQARDKLLDAALGVIRAQGYAGTSVDDLCRAAGVTKGAFFHHFPSKEALAVEAAARFAAMADTLFANAPFRTAPDPLARLLGYVAFRRDIIAGEFADFTCLVGTMVQESYFTSPAIRAACEAAIFGHAATLEPDIAAAMAARGMAGDPASSAASLARHIQAVIQGAFILAKASRSAAVARESLDHLHRYLELLFNRAAA